MNAQMLQLACPAGGWIVLSFGIGLLTTIGCVLRGMFLAFAPAALLAEAAARDVIWWIVGLSRATRERSRLTPGLIPQVSSRGLVLARTVLSGMLAQASTLASLGLGAWLATCSAQIQVAVEKRPCTDWPSKLRAWASCSRRRRVSRS